MSGARAAALLAAAADLGREGPDKLFLDLLDRARRADPSLSCLRRCVDVLHETGRGPLAADMLTAIPDWMMGPDGPDCGWSAKMREGYGLSAPGDPAGQLILSFCFPPFAESAGYVMAKRLADMDAPADIISNDMSGRSRLDTGFYTAIRPLIGQHLVLNCENRPASAASCRDFAEGAVAALASRRFGREEYERVYSRSMWPQSHFAAALMKRQGRAGCWTAEFSDPCRLDIFGQESRAANDDGWIETSGLADELRQRGFPVPAGRSLLYWCEYLAFCLADEIVFTNPNQRDAMLTQDYPSDVLARAVACARIAPHPLPAPDLIAAAPPSARPDDGLHPARIGYFGHANPRRGGAEILDALAALPMEIRAAIRFHIFGRQSAEFCDAVTGLGVAALIRAEEALPYLEAFSRMREMDYLLIGDTKRAERFEKNPYLPSKYADYLAAGRPLIALVEPGSILSEARLPEGSYRVRLKETEGLAEVLGTIVEERFLPLEAGSLTSCIVQ
ncbi:hypothetical protein [Paracoccus sp. SCSIO 75233]|uniref:hypothetical protein n=1 Tax=Paracoccus sp. SCSIO 75233 TaxID=3017782 RepID=UPI0022F044CF|nr:hypothetical protein [Paracoccus sp. SCSIO 75233]WBU55237.1 hypothetical protein PAF12_17775 [Paracoccus sp. SCSIO 75233]